MGPAQGSRGARGRRAGRGRHILADHAPEARGSRRSVSACRPRSSGRDRRAPDRAEGGGCGAGRAAGGGARSARAVQEGPRHRPSRCARPPAPALLAPPPPPSRICAPVQRKEKMCVCGEGEGEH